MTLGISFRTTSLLRPVASAELKWLFVGLLLVSPFLTTSLLRAASCQVPPSGLISWWPADGNANDIIGSNNGSLQGGATIVTNGQAGSAFLFDGNSGYVAIGDSPTLRPTNLTVEAWVRFASLNSSGSGAPAGDQYIVFKQNSRSTSFEGYELGKTRISGGDVFEFLITSVTGVSVDLIGTTFISTNVWYHIAGVRGSNFVQLYVNGHLEIEASIGFPQDYGNFPLYFGTSGQSSWDRKLNGWLDEVSIYNRALSSNEVVAIYNAGAAGKCQAPRINVQPSSQTVAAGANVNLTVTASGAAPLAFQWQRSNTNLVDGGNVSGASSSSLSFAGIGAGDSAQYRVTITNVSGSITSATAILTVAVPAPAQITNQAATAILVTSATLAGQVLATGGDAPAVTLYYGPADGGTNAAAWGQSIPIGIQSGQFTQPVTGLASNTTYYFTAKAVNAYGVSWASPSLTFTTLATNPAPVTVSVLTQHNDLSRTGANLFETLLKTNNVNSGQFGMLYTRPVDDQVYAQPLIAAGVNVPGKGVHNLLIVATVNDTMYAFDADDSTVTTPYWTNSFLAPNVVPPSWNDVLGSPCGSFRNISGSFGILGTPVIDPLTGTIYVVARTKEFGTNYVQRLHAIDLATGVERPASPVIIAASMPGNGTGSISGVLIFDPFKQSQRSGLALVNGTIYIGWASHCDWDPYHGWLLGYNATNLQQVLMYNTSPNGSEAGIWMSGQAPAADTSGNIYISTGNGSVGMPGDPANLINRGESFLKLTPSGTNLVISSWFTPYNFQDLEDGDLDLGSAGILLIPGTTMAFSGGKEGKAYLVNRDNMGGLSGAPGADTNVIQSFQVTSFTAPNNIHGGPVWWDGPDGSYAYVQGETDFLRQYKFDRTQGMFGNLTYAQSPTAAPYGMPGGILAVSANGTNAGSGIVWASHPYSGDAVGATVPGILHAYDAQNVSHELWNSQQVQARDGVGYFAKFVPPTEANGKVYLATFSNRINVYGLLASMTAPQISISPSNVNFGSASVGQSLTLNVQFANAGGLTLTGSVSTTAPFSIQAGSPFSLGFSQTGVVQVTFAPNSVGSFTNQLIFTSNGGNRTNLLIGAGSSVAQLAVTPASLNFGLVAAGSNSQSSFSITNLGGGTLANGNAVVSGGPFSIISGTPFNLPGFGATNLVVPFSPTSAGNFSNTITVTSSNGGNSTNAVSGSAAVVPTANFVGTPLSGTWPLAVTFSDTSTGTITNSFWDFGDGSTTNTSNTAIAHGYAFPGTNTVTLTVSGPVGTNSFTQPAYVIVTNPAPVTLTIQLIGNQVQLTWPNGTLQSSGDLEGPYTNVPSVSPYNLNPSSDTQFFRVKVR
jgi:PKD repeat protein